MIADFELHCFRDWLLMTSVLPCFHSTPNQKSIQKASKSRRNFAHNSLHYMCCAIAIAKLLCRGFVLFFHGCFARVSGIEEIAAPALNKRKAAWRAHEPKSCGRKLQLSGIYSCPIMVGIPKGEESAPNCSRALDSIGRPGSNMYSKEFSRFFPYGLPRTVSPSCFFSSSAAGCHRTSSSDASSWHEAVVPDCAVQSHLLFFRMSAMCS